MAAALPLTPCTPATSTTSAFAIRCSIPVLTLISLQSIHSLAIRLHSMKVAPTDARRRGLECPIHDESLRDCSWPDRPGSTRRVGGTARQGKDQGRLPRRRPLASGFRSRLHAASSWIGSGSLLGGAENAYKHGFAALWQSAGGWAGLALIYFIAPRARKFAQFTIPDLLEARYNQTARVLGVIAVLFAYTAITSYQFIGGGDILHLIFPSHQRRHTANTFSPASLSLHDDCRDGLGRLHGRRHWHTRNRHDGRRASRAHALRRRLEHHSRDPAGHTLPVLRRHPSVQPAT